MLQSAWSLVLVLALVTGCSSSEADMDRSVVLVHGSWMGAWSWDAVAVELEGRGYRVVSFDLPGHGDDPMPPQSVTLEDYVNAVIARLEAEGRPSVLVGHSMAGVVITQVAERRPDLVERLVYVAAYVPTDGQSLLDWALTDSQSVLAEEGALEYSAEGALAGIREDLIVPAFCGDCDETARALVRSRIRPEPSAPLGTAVTRSADAWGTVTRRYVRTTMDRAVSTYLQDRMLEATPMPTVNVDTGHVPMLTAASALADAIANGD